MADIQLKSKFTYGTLNKNATKTFDVPLSTVADVQLKNLAKAYGSLINNYKAVANYKVATTDIGIE